MQSSSMWRTLMKLAWERTPHNKQLMTKLPKALTYHWSLLTRHNFITFWKAFRLLPVFCCLEKYLVTFLNLLKVSTHCYFWLPRGSILALLYQHWFQLGIFQLKFMKNFIFCCLQNQNNNRIDLYHLSTQPSSRQKRLKIHIYLSSWGHAALMEFMSSAWTPYMAWISTPLIWGQMILLKKTHTDTYIYTHT